MPQVETGGGWSRWLPSFGLVVALHLIVWWGFTHFKSEIVPPQPLPVVQVSLLVPPVPPVRRVVPLQPAPPKVERQPKSVVEKAVSAPTPVPVLQPIAEHAMQQAPVAVAPPAPPSPAPPQPASEPVSPPRYNADYLSNPPPTYPDRKSVV